jgi:hypothetical protein
MNRIPGLEMLPIAVWVLLMALILIWPAARICRKAGFSPLLGVLAVVPIANIVLLWFVALADWPARSE